MRVLHISVSDNGNGALLNAFRLHQGLRRLGVDSSMFVQRRLDETGDETIKEYRGWPVGLVWRAKTRAYRYWISRERSKWTLRPNTPAFIYDRAAAGDRAISQMPEADVIYIHGINGFLDYFRDLPLLAQRAPIVFRLCDMSFFTGGCTHDCGCGRFVERCGKCPQLLSKTEHDLSRRIWERKRAVFSQIGGRLYAVAPSQWIAQEAKRSSLLRDCRIEVIPNGIDVQIFRPREQQMARELLDIPPGVRVLLYVAQPVDRWEKGFMYVVEALQQVKDWRDLFLVIAGGGKIPAEVPVQHLRLGRVRDERILSLAYSAADIFVMPSLRETFGVTAIEAMAAGTPVVAFATGGIRETVREGITGRLVPTGDARALGQRIEELLQDPSSRSRMAANGRRTAMEEYSLPVIAKHHAEFCARIAELPRPVWESRPIPEPQNALGIN